METSERLYARGGLEVWEGLVISQQSPFERTDKTSGFATRPHLKLHISTQALLQLTSVPPRAGESMPLTLLKYRGLKTSSSEEG